MLVQSWQLGMDSGSGGGKKEWCVVCMFVCLFKFIKVPNVQQKICLAAVSYVELSRVHIH